MMKRSQIESIALSSAYRVVIVTGSRLHQRLETVVSENLPENGASPFSGSLSP